MVGDTEKVNAPSFQFSVFRYFSFIEIEKMAKLAGQRQGWGRRDDQGSRAAADRNFFLLFSL